MLDAGRKYDLEELDKLRRGATSLYQRDFYEKLMIKITRETGDVRSLREDLIQAIRHDDLRSIKRINLELDIVRRRQLNGRLTNKQV